MSIVTECCMSVVTECCMSVVTECYMSTVYAVQLNLYYDTLTVVFFYSANESDKETLTV